MDAENNKALTEEGTSRCNTIPTQTWRVTTTEFVFATASGMEESKGIRANEQRRNQSI